MCTEIVEVAFYLSLAGTDHAVPHWEKPATAIFNEFPKQFPYDWKGQLVPRDILGQKKLRFQTFRPHAEPATRQATSIKHIDLTDVWHIKYSIEYGLLSHSGGLLPSLPCSTLSSGLTVFHKTCRQRPQTIAGLDGALAHKNFAIVLRYTTDDHFGVVIMDGRTGAANIAFTVVIGWNAAHGGGATVGTKIHYLSSVCRGHQMAILTSMKQQRGLVTSPVVNHLANNDMVITRQMPTPHLTAEARNGTL